MSMSEVGSKPRALLQRAMQLHSADEIDNALASATEAIAHAPAFCEAHAYLGNTLVTRKRRFADGLAELELAAKLCPKDPGILYTLGWVREFIANALEKPRRPHQPVEPDASTLYAAATTVLRQALMLDPEPQLMGDIEDILDVVANTTGVPWDEALERDKDT
jgi:tetratricopeptide (TPR) repeat protein